MSKVLFSISLARKAGALVTGFDAVQETVMKGKTDLVLLAQDISDGTKKRALRFCEDLVEVYQIPDTQFALSAITKKPVAVFCVTDENLAQLCRKTLASLQAQPIQTQTEDCL